MNHGKASPATPDWRLVDTLTRLRDSAFIDSMTKPRWCFLVRLTDFPFHALVCFVLLVCFATGCSREAKRDRYVKRANRYYESKEYQKATIEYLNALRLDPENALCIR